MLTQKAGLEMQLRYLISRELLTLKEQKNMYIIMKKQKKND